MKETIVLAHIFTVPAPCPKHKTISTFLGNAGYGRVACTYTHTLTHPLIYAKVNAGLAAVVQPQVEDIHNSSPSMIHLGCDSKADVLTRWFLITEL